jgi:hypothetical protein
LHVLSGPFGGSAVPRPPASCLGGALRTSSTGGITRFRPASTRSTRRGSPPSGSPRWSSRCPIAASSKRQSTSSAAGGTFRSTRLSSFERHRGLG